jgi:putative ABC transport system permease protein
MRALDRKLLRDLRYLRGQVVAISLVVACGVATVVTTRTAYDSLVSARADYYARCRFADVFAHLKRAPESMRARIAAIPGVAAVETRVVADVTLDVPGLGEPAAGRLVSLPDGGEPLLNAVHLRAGRLLDPARRDEALVSEAFARANRLRVGDTLGAILNGRWERLRIVGLAISPEYVYEIRPADLFPDPQRFGVIWMSRAALGPAFDLDGAFDDVSLALVPGANEAEVIGQLDHLLERHGGLGAYGRDEQVSARFVSDEIAQNRITGTVLPLIFLGVAAFLLHIVLSRLVSMQREQIAVLKAFGYAHRTVALHYLLLAMTAVGIGAVLGTLLGLWLGSVVNGVYREFYHFPRFPYEPGAGAIALAVGVSAIAAALGALSAVRRVMALPPAEAMRPEPPARFRAGWLEQAGLLRRLTTPGRLIARNLSRRPVRAGLSVLGLALAVAILVLARFFSDAIQTLSDVQFRSAQREDVSVSFHEPLSERARFDLGALPGVLAVETYRAVPARIRFEHRSRRVAVLGLPAGPSLRRVVDRDGRPVKLAAEGAVLTSHLARLLEVKPGDDVTLELLEGRKRVLRVPVAALADELIGLNVYVEARTLARLLEEEGSVSGAFLRVDGAASGELYRRLKRMPAVAGVGNRLAALASFEATLARNLGVMNAILVAFSCVIAAAMVYNSARIALSERSRELASLRVLGFTQREVTQMLLGEQALLLVLALPLGFWIGHGLAKLLADAYAWELFRMPLVVTAVTYAYSALVAAIAALGSGALVRRRLRSLDLVTALKSRD